MFKTSNLLNIGFPIYLVIFEILLRSISGVNTSAFIGPTLAASGLGLLVGVINPKKIAIDATVLEMLKQKGVAVTVRDKQDEKLVLLGWVFILVELLVWYCACAMTIQVGEHSPGPMKSTFALYSLNQNPLLLGVLNYVISIILTSVKESEK